MTALDDVDGVDLDIAEMGDRIRHGLRPIAERRARVEPLRAQPDAPGFGLAHRMEFDRAGHHSTSVVGFA
jgi:hypothetical protein